MKILKREANKTFFYRMQQVDGQQQNDLRGAMTGHQLIILQRDFRWRT
jgi:hypothetical protein